MIQITKEAAEKIKETRKSMKIKQQDLAKMIGISGPNLSKIENNEKGIREDVLEKICEILNLDYSSLIDGNHQRSIFELERFQQEDVKILENRLVEEEELKLNTKTKIKNYEKVKKYAEVKEGVIHAINSDIVVVLTASVFDLNDENMELRIEEDGLSPIEDVAKKAVIAFLEKHELLLRDEIANELNVNMKAMERFMKSLKR